MRRIACLLAIGLTFAAVGSPDAPDARAAAPQSASAVLPAAFLGIGDENEPDENEADEGVGDSAAGRESEGSGTSLPVLLMIAGLGVAAVGFAARLVRRVRARFRRFVRAL